MLPANKEAELVERYAVIEDPQERLSAAVGRAKKLPPLPEAERRDERRVQGCTSRLWLVGEVREGRCYFQLDADSSLVRGLAVFSIEIYQGALPAEVVAHEPQVLEKLRLTQQLSPTRLHGLHQLRLAVKAFAEAAQQSAA